MLKYVITLALLFSASTVYSVTIDISGVITSVGDPANVLDGYVYVGASFTGSYTYNMAPDTTYHGTNISQYLYTSNAVHVVIDINGLIFETDVSDPHMIIEIHNDRDVTNDVFLWHSYNNVVSSGIGIDTISWNLQDDSRTALTSTALPDSAMNLSDWLDMNLFNISNTTITGPEVNIYDIKGTVTSTAIAPAVPEPMTIVLALLGSVSLVLKRFF